MANPMRKELIKDLCESTAKSEICDKKTIEDCRFAKGDCGFCTITADFLIKKGWNNSSIQVDCAKAILDEYAERLKSDFTLASSDGNIPFCEIIDELTDTMKSEYRSYPDFTDLIVEKSIKAFVERLKGEICDSFGFVKHGKGDIDIDKLVKEFLNKNKSSQSETDE